MKSDSLLSELETQFNALNDLIENLPEGKFAQTKAPGKWSDGQIARHLLLSTQVFVNALNTPKDVLAEKFGTRTEREEKGRDELMAMYAAALGKGLSAPARLTPGEVTENQKPETLSSLRQSFIKLGEALRWWTEDELSRYYLPHPAFGMLTIREMLVFTIFHTDHHMAQMN